MTETLRRLPGGLLHRLRALLSPSERRFARVRPQIESVEGLLSPGQERWLFEAATRMPDGATIVEVGAYKGRSTACLALACRGTRKRVYSLDTFDGNTSDFSGPGRHGFFDEWQANLSRLGVLEYVTPIRGDSRTTTAAWDRPIHLAFIDASHVHEDVLHDFESLYPHVVRGGLIALHDVGSHDGPTRVWAEKQGLLIDTGSSGNLAFGTKPR